MSDKELLQFAVTLPWVILLAIAGGLVAFIRRLNQATKPQPLHTVFTKLAGELFISGFAGFITYLLCREWEVSANIAAVAVAISGHLGGNAIDKIVSLWDVFASGKTLDK